MTKKKFIFKKNIYFSIFLYATLLAGFFWGENLNYGAKPDWYNTNFPVIRDFSENFIKTFYNYDQYNHRHSPVYLIFLSFFSKIGINFDLIRFLHFNLSITLIYIFFKSLILKLKNIDKNILFLLLFSIFLSPTFRSLAIWPDSRIIGLTFFTLSIYEFLKFNNSKNISSFYKNIIYILIASYISPNFSVFIIFYFFCFLKNVNKKHILIGIFLCGLSSLPALYYLFVLDINFLLAKTPGADINDKVSLDFNISNKILIVSTIVFFHLIPFLFEKKFLNEFILSVKKNFFLVLIFFIINKYFFDYLRAFTGGGFFFQLSLFLFNNNLIFFIFSFFSLLIIIYLIKSKFINFLLFLLLILSNIQNTIYHKYYDPLIMILFFLLFVHFLPIKFLSRKRNLIFIYLFYLSFISFRIIKNSFL